MFDTNNFEKIQAEGGKNEESEFVPNPKLGVFLMLVNTFVSAFSWLAIKWVFILEPDLIGIQVVLLRSIFATFVTILYVNKNLKNAMWDKVQNDQFALLA